MDPLRRSLEGNLRQDAATLGAAPKQIGYAPSTSGKGAEAEKGLSQCRALRVVPFGEEWQATLALAEIAGQAEQLAGMLYSYRAVGPGVPGAAQLRENAGLGEAELELCRAALPLLAAEVQSQLQLYHMSLSTADMVAKAVGQAVLGMDVAHMSAAGCCAGLAHAFVRALDRLVQLDATKSRKRSLRADVEVYLRFARALGWADGSGFSAEKAAAVEQLLAFLVDPVHLVQHFQALLASFPNHAQFLESVLVRVAEIAQGYLTQAPGHLEHADLLAPVARTLPVLLFLLNQARGPQALANRFAEREYRLCVLFLEQMPLVPVWGDLTISPQWLLDVLRQRFGMAEVPMAKACSFQELALGLVDRGEYGAYTVDLAAYRARHAALMQAWARMQIKAAATRTEETGAYEKMTAADARHAAGLAAKSVDLVNGLVFKLRMYHAWQMTVHRPQQDRAALTQFEKCVRGNYREEEKGVVLELVALAKGVAAFLEKAAQGWLAPHLKRCLTVDMMKFFMDVLPAVAFRKSDRSLEARLFSFQAVAIDYTAAMRHARALREPAMPSALQVFHLHHMASALLETQRRQTAQYVKLGKQVLQDAQVLDLQGMVARCSTAYEVLEMNSFVQDRASLAFLRDNEFYFEEAARGFPAGLSLPWLLIEQAYGALDTQPALVLVPFEVYNDTLANALASRKRQHLFHELQAELNLAFDQLVFKAAESIFKSCKVKAAIRTMDNDLMFKLGSKLPVCSDRLSEFFALQRHFALFGRSIDFNRLVTVRLNKLFRENLEYLVERFEAQDVRSGAFEFSSLLHVLRTAHVDLAQRYGLDEWGDLFRELNEAVALASFSSRLLFAFGDELVQDLVPNSLYNPATQRFIPSRIVLYERPHGRAAWPVLPSPMFLYGAKEINEPMREWAKLHAMFFGWQHVRCLHSFLALGEVVALANMFRVQIADLLTGSLRTGFKKNAAAFANLVAESEGVAVGRRYAFLQAHLGPFATEPAVKEMFQALRVVGNYVVLLDMFDDADQFLLTDATAAEASPAKAGQRTLLASLVRSLSADCRAAWDLDGAKDGAKAGAGGSDFRSTWSCLLFLFCESSQPDHAFDVMGQGVPIGGYAVLRVLDQHLDYTNEDPSFRIEANNAVEMGDLEESDPALHNFLSKVAVARRAFRDASHML